MSDTPCPTDSPLMREWENYKQSDDYANSFKWAAHEEHRQGSMWGAFMAGFLAAKNESHSQREEAVMNRVMKWKWIKADTPPPEKYHSNAMNRIPLLIAFEPRGPEDTAQDKWPVVGCYIGGLVQEWRRDGSPNSWRPTHWMPMPCNPNIKPAQQEEAGK